jgi:aconitate hydratase
VSLVAQILAAHLAGRGTKAPAPELGDALEIRADHALAGGVAAVVALGAFQRLGLDRARPELCLIGAERHAPQAAFESADELRDLQQSAFRFGVRFTRPGDGRCERVHLEHFAAPGRVLAAAGRRAPVAGAVGMLSLPVGALECAAVLAGEPVEMRWPGSRAVEIRGVLGPGVDGHDAALALHARLEDAHLDRALVEFDGETLIALPIEARAALAAAAAECGAGSSVFASDETTRRWLATEGREADWKRLARADPAADALVFDLDAIEPLAAPLERPAACRPVREVRGTSIGAVLIGPGASVAALARLARALAGRRVKDGVTLIIVPGTRQVRETAQAAGLLEALVAAGADVHDAGAPPVAAAVGVCVGTALADLPPGRTRWQAAGLATGAAAALEGVLEDPRRVLEHLGESDADLAFAADSAPRVGPATEPDGAVPPFPTGRPFLGAVRGSVLLKLGDDVSTERLVPWGAKVRPLVGHLDALAQFTLDDEDPGFAARARAAGGGVLVAGERFGSGVPWDTAALAPLALGVRVMLARSLAPEFAHVAALAGVLPLEFVNEGDARAVAAGDELEIPGLPEALAPGRALVVRNLTQGTQYTVRHPLAARDVDRLAVGGLLAALRPAS